MEYSNYLDEVRSPYKVASVTAHGHSVARQPALASSGPVTGAGPMAAAHSSHRHVQLQPPREEDEEEEEEEEEEEDSGSTEW